MFHNFIGADTGYISCMTCGGMWQDNDPASTVTNYSAANGDEVIDCTPTGHTSCHHYSGECGEDTCTLNPECNCLFCA
jgi:hypothetical protein